MFKKLLALFFVVTLVSACSSHRRGTEIYEDIEIKEKIVEEVEISVPDRVFFEFNTYHLGTEARRTLDTQAEWLLADSVVEVVIEGNTDERGSREYNLALGQKRADAVKKYLVNKGVRSSRITAISNGKEKPWTRGTSEAARAQNRNAQTVVVVR